MRKITPIEIPNYGQPVSEWVLKINELVDAVNELNRLHFKHSTFVGKDFVATGHFNEQTQEPERKADYFKCGLCGMRIVNNQVHICKPEKEPECEHEWRFQGQYKECHKCWKLERVCNCNPLAPHHEYCTNEKPAKKECDCKELVYNGDSESRRCMKCMTKFSVVRLKESK